MTDEKRRFTRIPFDCRVKLEDSEGKSAEGHLVDVSIKGMQVQIDNYEPLSSPAKFQVVLGEPAPSFTIEGEAEIARASEDGHLGLFLLKIDIDGLTHLRRLVELNTGDPEQTTEEITHW